MGNPVEVDPSLRDFRNFVYLLWRHLKLPPPTPVQYDICEFLQHGPKRRMVKAFRGVGKSWLTSAYALWRLYLDPEECILVVSASKDRADAFAVFVRRLISEVPMLQHLEPRTGSKGIRDSSLAFDVGPASPKQSPSVKSQGITGQITGSRATVVIADDIEVPKNSLTQTMRQRLSEAVKEFDSILLPDGEIIYLGTDQTEMSLYRSLPERGYTLRVWPARVPTVEKLHAYGDTLAPMIRQMVDEGTPALTPTDPQRFTNVDLMEREASYGRAGFAMQFMLDPSMSDLDRFPLRAGDLMVADADPEMAPSKIIWGSGPEQVLNDLDCMGIGGDRFHRPMLIDTREPPAPYTLSVMFIDPSGRGKDETAYAIVKACMGKLWLVASGGYTDGFSEETLKGVAMQAAMWKVNTILIEPNYGGGMFRSLFEPVLWKIHKCSVEDSPWAKGQKEHRIIDTLSPVMEMHRLVVDRRVIERDLRVSEHTYSLIHQMTRLTRERGSLVHDDRLEALAGAVGYCMDQMSIDEDQARAQFRQELLEREFEGWDTLELTFGGPPPPDLWNNPRGIQH